MKKNFLYFVVFVSLFGSRSLAQEILLPDQTFNIKVIEKISGAKAVNTDDELIIYANKVSSAFSKKDGFPPAIINFQQEDKSNLSSFTYTAGCTNAKNCALKWSGVINGDKIDGKVQKFFLGTLSGEYTFTGTLKKEK
jgi:hypothetical protein